ncbi:transposase [Streptomyces rapamycinicus NRRL 5491]|uniref:Transposase n=1 Tax=Streptomyces rapamycinicus (strain ATCC 29253 / DSM 41530 / NRRL 5491 / AYB-994) TaxID=1343740 RepID=A0A3L8R2F1_STRRN|nr:transposase [Streptomyces rapamycinicus NRRL 5491]
MVKGGDLADARLWASELDAVHERFVHRFGRSEPRESALAYMRGLIAPLQRKNGWTLAEEAGHAGPDRIQRMLNRPARLTCRRTKCELIAALEPLRQVRVRPWWRPAASTWPRRDSGRVR